MRNLPLLSKGFSLLRELKSAGIPIYSAVSALRAHADDSGSLSGVEFRVGSQTRKLSCRSLLIHQGVVPNVQLTRALGLTHHWHELQQCWHPRCDEWGQSSTPEIFVAGDGAGIAGALAAEHRGTLAALEIAHQLDALSAAERDREAAPARRALVREQAIRPFLDALYQPAREFLSPANETVVCRCEEVTAAELRQMAREGCRGPNQTKAFCRSGMGPCQGRLCGLTVSQILAEQHGVPVDEVGYYQIRMPIKPLTLGELADLKD